jgi:formyl-CoA transferase
MGSYVPGTAATGEELAPFGAGPRRPIPYSTFRAKDDYIVVGCATASLWRKLCDALDRPDWKFMQVNQERADQLTSQFLDMPADHWLEVLERHGVPAAKVLNLLEAIRALRISRWSDVVEEGPVGLAGVEQ